MNKILPPKQRIIEGLRSAKENINFNSIKWLIETQKWDVLSSIIVQTDNESIEQYNKFFRIDQKDIHWFTNNFHVESFILWLSYFGYFLLPRYYDKVSVERIAHSAYLEYSRALSSFLYKKAMKAETNELFDILVEKYDERTSYYKAVLRHNYHRKYGFYNTDSDDDEIKLLFNLVSAFSEILWLIVEEKEMLPTVLEDREVKFRNFSETMVFDALVSTSFAFSPEIILDQLDRAYKYYSKP